MTYAKTKIVILVTAAAAVPFGVQVNSIADLKEEVRRFETLETELVEREDRIAKLEATFAAAALPPEVRSEATRGNTSQRVSLLAGSQRGANRSRGTGGVATNGIGAPSRGKASEEEKVVSQPDVASLSASTAEKLKDPAMRSGVIKYMEVQLASTHGEFIDYAVLDDNKRAELSAAILDRKLATSGLKSVDENGKRLAVPSNATERAAVKADHDARIKRLIGDAKFGEFERFDRSPLERSEIASFRSLIEERGEILPFEKALKLITLMDEVRMPTRQEFRQEFVSARRARIENGGSPEGGPSPSSYPRTPEGIAEYTADRASYNRTPEGIAERVITRRARQERVLARVSQVLTSDQFEVFKENQANHFRTWKSRLER